MEGGRTKTYSEVLLEAKHECAADTTGPTRQFCDARNMYNQHSKPLFRDVLCFPTCGGSPA